MARANPALVVTLTTGRIAVVRVGQLWMFGTGDRGKNQRRVYQVTATRRTHTDGPEVRLWDGCGDAEWYPIDHLKPAARVRSQGNLGENK